MLAALLLASLLAQAEPAPPEPAAQPPTSLPSASLPPAVPPPNAVSVNARFAYRLGVEGSGNLGPAGGFSLGGTFERRYFLYRGLVELGGAIDFGYSRFARSVQNPMTSPDDVATFSERALSTTTFALLQTVAVTVGRFRPFVALGPGLAIDFFSSPDLQTSTEAAVQPIARASAGVEIMVAANMALVVRGDLTHPFTNPTFGSSTSQTPAPRYELFGDIVGAGFGLLVRF